MEISMAPTAAVLRSRTRRAARLLAPALALLGAALLPVASRAEPPRAGGRFLFSATVGGGAAAPKVLLLWVVTEGPSPYATYLLKRRADFKPALADLATVARIDDQLAIEAVFPPGSAIRDDLMLALEPELGPALSARLLALRGLSDPASKMQYRMLVNANYGVSITEGVAYLDTAVVVGTRYLYELWGIDPGTGAAVERLGKVWALAGTDTMLPQPEGLDAVRMADIDLPPRGNFPDPADGDIDVDGDGELDGGEFGDGKIYLTWKPNRAASPVGRETEPPGFGYNILRSDKPPLDPCPPLPPAGVFQVNQWPVLAISAPPDPKKMLDFFFVDDGSNEAIPPLAKGQKYCYWLVPRNLLGQGGTPSEVREACAPDLGVPRQVREVKAQVLSPSSAGIKVSWAPNTNDPVTLDGGTRYIDDTATYRVYRFTDFKSLLKPPPDPTLCAVDPSLNPCVVCSVAAPLTSCTDSQPASSFNRGKIYWYAVTALDTPACDNPANESPYSAPVRGVVYDETPPTINYVVPFCKPGPTCPPATGSHELPCIRCWPCDPSHTVCPPADPNDDAWCLAGGSIGMFPRSCDDWGYEVRAAGPPPMDADTMSVRLYRGAKGKDFRPVEEAFLTGPADTAWDAHEQFRTRVSQKLEYRLRALDRDANIGVSVNPAVPAYLQGTAPPPRSTIVRSVLQADGDWQIQWHAPGAEALVGFLLRVGKAGDRFSALLFEILPDNNALASEAMIGMDVDGSGGPPSPYRIITRNATQILADKEDLGPLLSWDPVAKQFGRTLSGLALEEDAVVEIYAIDVAGVLSEPAIAGPLPPDPDPDALTWPARPSPSAFPLAAVFVNAPTDYVALCWDRGQPFPGGAVGSHPKHVAVFRARVESDGDRPDGFQQRSPRLDVDAYDRGGPALGDELDCSDCEGALEDLRGGVGAVRPACWRDYGIPGAGIPSGTYRYTVLGFSDPPPTVDPEVTATADPRKRNEGEIDTVYGSPPAEVVVP
jgi:hypothetical protein